MEKIVPCRKVHCGVRQGRGPGPIFTVRKRSCGKVMSLHLCVSHSVHRGVSTSVHAGIHTPPWAETPWADTPTSRQTPRAWAWTRTPPRQRSPWADTPSPSPADRYCCGRYAFYWNALWFSIVLAKFPVPFPWISRKTGIKYQTVICLNTDKILFTRKEHIMLVTLLFV